MVTKVAKVKKVKEQAQEQEVMLLPLEIKKATITIKGISPLMTNPFDTKSIEQIATDRAAKENGIKLKKVFDSPREQYLRTFYLLKGKPEEKGAVYAMPASGIKKALVTAAKFLGDRNLSGTRMQGALHVLEVANGLVPIVSKSGPVMDSRMGRVGPFGAKKPKMIHRARFDEWECTFTVTYRPDMISPTQLVTLFEHAGFSVGLCEFRPEKSGSMGCFEIKRT